LDLVVAWCEKKLIDDPNPHAVVSAFEDFT
jgi:hypothetical protein